jgi:WD40 repeat protein
MKGMRSYHLMSASWDQTINIWNLSSSGLTALTSLKGHDSIVYSGCWNPKMSGIIKNLEFFLICRIIYNIIVVH